MWSTYYVLSIHNFLLKLILNLNLMIDNALYTFNKNQLQSMSAKRDSTPPVINSPMLLEGSASKKILEEDSSSFDKIDSDDSPNISSRISSKKTLNITSPTFDKNIPPNSLFQKKKVNFFIDISPKSQKDTETIINQSSHMFGEDDSATEEIIDDDYSSDLSIVDTNFENSKMCRQLIKALYNTNQYNQNINQIIEDFQIDVELIREKSQIENAANKESMHKPHYNPLYDFDNDVQIPDDFDTNTNLLCFVTIPRIVYMEGELFIIYVTPDKIFQNEFEIVFKKAETGIQKMKIRVKDLTMCVQKTERSFMIQFIHSKHYTKVNLEIILKIEDECDKMVRGLNLIMTMNKSRLI